MPCNCGFPDAPNGERCTPGARHLPITFFPKGWSDQPDEVVDLPVVLKIHSDGRLCELRAASDDSITHAFLTVGNLFGSATLRCSSLRHAVKALDAVAHLGSGQTLKALPAGCTLLPGTKS